MVPSFARKEIAHCSYLKLPIASFQKLWYLLKHPSTGEIKALEIKIIFSSIFISSVWCAISWGCLLGCQRKEKETLCAYSSASSVPFLRKSLLHLIFFPITSSNGFFLVFKVSYWLGFKYINSSIFASALFQSFVSCYPTPSTARSLPSHDATLLISHFQSHTIHYPYSTKSSAPQTLARQKVAHAVPGCGGSTVQLVVWSIHEDFSPSVIIQWSNSSKKVSFSLVYFPLEANLEADLKSLQWEHRKIICARTIHSIEIKMPAISFWS